jgi:hypothetical protein
MRLVSEEESGKVRPSSSERKMEQRHDPATTKSLLEHEWPIAYGGMHRERGRAGLGSFGFGTTQSHRANENMG